jgi:hypothetical protein
MLLYVHASSKNLSLLCAFGKVSFGEVSLKAAINFRASPNICPYFTIFRNKLECLLDYAGKAYQGKHSC